jgi:hypothetical protein
MLTVQYLFAWELCNLGLRYARNYVVSKLQYKNVHSTLRKNKDKENRECVRKTGFM